MKIKPFNVFPNLPESIKPLQEIAMNLWSSWNWQAAQIFIRIDAEGWEKNSQNLVKMLGQIPQSRFMELSEDPGFTANLERVWEDLDVYVKSKTWFDEIFNGNGASQYRTQENGISLRELSVAYFSMEFGIDVSLPIYSGGLGILSGDHLKSSSDLGIPLVGVGLLYQKGYFQQHLNSDGWQMEHYPINDWYNMPVTLQKYEDDKPIKIQVELGDETLIAQVWKVVIGRLSLYLLDANLPENPPHLREITDQLYGGDRENRIRQEILLGVGGVRALKALKINPTVFHMNEGHSAFLAIERIRDLIAMHGLSFAEAREIIWASTVFTTHTPVPAGNEAFAFNRVQRYFQRATEEVGITWDQFRSLGSDPRDENHFSLTALALKLAAHCNGVSKLHGVVSRRMWKPFWQGLPDLEVPIGNITNGIHTRTWLSHDMDELFIRYIGPHFSTDLHNPKLWERIDNIPDLELWRIHQIRKERLIHFTRKRLKEQLKRRGAGVGEVNKAAEALSSDALTVGFARRFAEYKRANLMLYDPERLVKIISNTDKPVQFIFAGKAHPHDEQGKNLIRDLVHFASDPRVRRSFVFIEDYDMNVARYMLQGVDIWLNTPRRPMEASGTSGMKAAANGAINVSTLDGWWAEAYDSDIGWAIGSGDVEKDSALHDRIEAEALYNLLEKDIIDTYYDLDQTEVPRNWIQMMKRSIKAVGSYFNTHRMVVEYCDKYYFPAHFKGQILSEKDFDRAKKLSKWRERIARFWNDAAVFSEQLSDTENIRTGENLPVRAKVRLGELSPEDVSVELLYGKLDEKGGFIHPKALQMDFKRQENDLTIYETVIECNESGRQGYAIRVHPSHPDLIHPFTPLQIVWEE